MAEDDIVDDGFGDTQVDQSRRVDVRAFARERIAQTPVLIDRLNPGVHRLDRRALGLLSGLELAIEPISERGEKDP